MDNAQLRPLTTEEKELRIAMRRPRSLGGPSQQEQEEQEALRAQRGREWLGKFDKAWRASNG